uniref:Uncharacterized protein n=1 Tax=Macrostomum lignano TaxID=282301 RepID=A0A1I8FS63_9PLAT
MKITIVEKSNSRQRRPRHPRTRPIRRRVFVAGGRQRRFFGRRRAPGIGHRSWLRGGGCGSVRPSVLSLCRWLCQR